MEHVFSTAGNMHGDLQKSAKDSTLEHSLFAAFNTDESDVGKSARRERGSLGRAARTTVARLGGGACATAMCARVSVPQYVLLTAC